jgi:flagellar motility protein MotE (MotC chaperone)
MGIAMKKIYNILVILCIAVVLALGGLAGAMAITGSLNSENIAKIVDILRGREKQEAAVAETAVPTSQPATSAITQIAVNEDAVELTSRRLERWQQELEYRQRQLEGLQRLIEQQREELRQARGVFQEEVQASENRLQDEGFRKQLKLFESMQPKQAKEVFMDMPANEAVEFLRALQPRISSKILREFKSDTEMTRLNELLNLMNTAG